MKKASLNVCVTPRLRALIKIKAASQGITMATLVETIIVEWEKSCTEHV